MISPSKNRLIIRTFPKLARITLVGFCMALALSLVGTVWSLYVKEIVGKDFYVSLIAAFISLVSLISYIFTTKIIERSNKPRLFKIALASLIVLYTSLAFYSHIFFFLIIAILITIFATIRINSFGILVKENSSEKDLSWHEGLIYTFLNLSWVIGPLITGALLGILKINQIFIVASLLLLFTLYIFSVSRITNNKKINGHADELHNAINFFKNKDRVIAYFLGGGVNFWWILIYTLMPLYVIERNFSDQYVGWLFFAVALPLILLEYPFSKLVSKVKYPTLFKIGYIIPAIAAISCYFISNSYIVFGLLILASIGMAMIEPTTESYFLKIVGPKQELKYYNIYNTGIDLNLLIGALLSAAVLYLFSFKYLFLLFGTIMFIFHLLSYKTKKIK